MQDQGVSRNNNRNECSTSREKYILIIIVNPENINNIINIGKPEKSKSVNLLPHNNDNCVGGQTSHSDSEWQTSVK